VSQGEGGGRPTKYRAQYPRQAKQLAKLGATDLEIARFFEIHIDTFYTWCHEHPKFSDAIRLGKAPTDRRVERSLYHRATGYSYPAVKIMVCANEVREIPYMEHVPPDSTAMIFWLKNRRRDKWRDFKATELSTAPGRPLETKTYVASGPELLQDYYAKLEQAAAAAPPDPGAAQRVGSDGSEGDESDGDPQISGR
jgi:hypothetical protein